MRGIAVAASLIAVSACAQPPDVLLITVDTLRVDHVSAFATDSPVRTPAIDSLANDGVRFTRAYSPISVTGPAFCTIHTGLLPGTHGVVMNLFRGGPHLSAGVTTLAEHLQLRGHETAAFVSGFTLRPELGLSQGFSTYDAPEGRTRTGRSTRTLAEAWLRDVDDSQRLFLWYHSFDPHGPLRRWGIKPGRRWRTDEGEQMHLPRYQRIGATSEPAYFAARYARAVAYSDAQVGALVSKLKDSGRYDNALIVFVADHGESFDERSLWFDHGFGAYEEQLHVPLILKLPGNVRAGEVVDAMVGLQDLLPTMLDVAGISTWRDMDGISILDAEDVPSDRVLIGESSHCKRNKMLPCDPEGPRGKELAARDGQTTVLQWPVAGAGLQTAVYDVGTDPAERSPRRIPPPPHLMAALAPVREARNTLTLVVPDLSVSAPVDQAEADEREALKALGYLDE
jgi:arylsulfatase A-like enzyme